MASTCAAGPDDVKDHSHHVAIATERAKCNTSFREELAPGLMIDMELKNILVMTHSKYQKVDVLETYFGRVGSTVVACSCWLLLL